MEGRTEPAGVRFIEDSIQQRWGLPVVTPLCDYMPQDVEGLIWRDGAGKTQGLITWAVTGKNAQIVTIDAFVQGAHIGGRLLDAAEVELVQRGVRRISIATTNDNLRALAFCTRRGYRLVHLHLDAMTRVRAIKPGVSATGADGIPRRDMWELEKLL